MKKDQKFAVLNKKYKIILFLVILLFSMILCLTAAFFMLRFKVKNENYLESRGLQQKVAQISSELAQQQYITNEMQPKIEKILAINEKNKLSLLLNEVYLIVDTASLYLRLEKNPQLALENLLAAEKIISDSPYASSLQIVSSALSRDIEDLKKMPKEDFIALALSIDKLAQDIISKFTDLPHGFRQEQKADPALTVTSASYEKTFKNISRHVWQDMLVNLKQAFIIRKKHESLPLLIMPGDKYALLLNMQSKLIIAEWAVLHGQGKLYKSNIDEVFAMLQSFATRFPSYEVKGVLDSLYKMQKIDLNSELPDLNASKSAIREAMLPRV